VTRTYHHLGIPTTEVRDGEMHLPHLKIFVSGYGQSEFNIDHGSVRRRLASQVDVSPSEWTRYEDDAPYPEIVKTVPHIAFEVEDLTAALEGRNVIIEPNSPSPGIVVAFIEESGAPIEFLQVERSPDG